MTSLHVPGKVILAGEYAVMRSGGYALVAAIDRGVAVEIRDADLDGAALLRFESVHVSVHIESGRAIWKTTPPAELVFAAAGFECAVSHGATLENAVITFASQVIMDGRKLGLGGSAAMLVAGFRSAGGTIDRPDIVRDLAATHRRLQGGRGSGVDVAACALGGLLRVTNDAGGPLVTRLSLPADLRILLGWTGMPASTSALIDAVAAYAQRDPHGHACRLEDLASAEEKLARALIAGDRENILAAVETGGDAARQLGVGAGTAIETAALTALRRAARLAGCAAKSSGAGGGDCGVVFCFGEEAREEAAVHVRAAGLVPIPVGIA